MPRNARHKTKYPGVYYITTSAGQKVFYISYWKKLPNGLFRKVEEKAGDVRRNDMTPSRAAAIRSRRIAGEELPNREKREKARRAEKWTINALWAEYRAYKGKPADAPGYAGGTADADYFAFKHIQNRWGKRFPSEITSLDVARFTTEKMKSLSGQTTKLSLSLLNRLVRFGVKHKLVHPFDFSIEYPKFDNRVTNPLDAKKLSHLLKVLDSYENRPARAMVLTALLTGLRRGSLLRLKWEDLDFDLGTIFLQRPKGTPDGAVVTIPFPIRLQELIKELPRRKGNECVFPGKNGGPMVDGKFHWLEIKRRAGLEGFRFHDLRHTFATIVASSGKVDIRELQRLLTHKTLAMTMRYSHLLDDRLRDASNAASEAVLGLAGRNEKPQPVTSRTKQLPVNS